MTAQQFLAQEGKPKPRPFRLKALIPLERDVQAACLDLLRRHPKVAFAARMNTGAMKLDKRFVRFGFPGCPDLWFMLKGGRLGLAEIKRPGGVVRPEQREFLDRAGQGGALALCIDDARELNDALKRIF